MGCDYSLTITRQNAGRLVLPVGTGQQRLLVITRREDGLEEELLDDVNFVPLLAGLAT